MSNIRGFTLLEVMVALVIVSLGMMAVNTQIGRYVSTAQYMEEKTLASWIGSNKIVELSVQDRWPDLGDSDEEVEFAGRMWHLEIDVTETDVENLRRVDVTIAHSESPDRIVHRISGIIEPPAPPGFVPVQWQSTGAGG